MIVDAFRSAAGPGGFVSSAPHAWDILAPQARKTYSAAGPGIVQRRRPGKFPAPQTGNFSSAAGPEISPATQARDFLQRRRPGKSPQVKFLHWMTDLESERGVFFLRQIISDPIGEGYFLASVPDHHPQLAF